MARHRFPLWLLAILVVCLAACAGAIDQTITFRADEAWETDVTLAFPGEVAPLLGSQIDGELSTLQQRIAAGGGEMNWERAPTDDSGQLTYTIDASGRGYDVLQDVSFMDMSVTASEQDGRRRQLAFSAAPVLDAASQTLTLVGGEILSTNGTVTGNDTVTWTNSPVVMEAVLTERGGAGGLPLIPLLAGAALIGGGGLLALFLLRRRALSPSLTPSPSGGGLGRGSSDAPSPSGRGSSAPPSPNPSHWAGDQTPSPGGGGLGRGSSDAPSPSGRGSSAPPSPNPSQWAGDQPSATRYCVNCGSSLRSGARFCAACGHPQPD